MGKVRIGTDGMEEWSRHVGAMVKAQKHVKQCELVKVAP